MAKAKAKDVEVEDLDTDDTDDAEEAVETVTASAVAKLLDVDPKVFRRFMRARITAKGGQVGVDTPGSGGRYAIPADEVNDLMEAFADWARPRAATKVKVVEIEDEDYDEADVLEEEFVAEDEDASDEEDDDTDEDEVDEIEELG
jgi:hypothetical protein